MIGRMTIGARAAPVFHAVTGQKEWGNFSSETPNRSLISIAALVIDVELRPTMSVLERSISADLACCTVNMYDTHT